RRLRGGTGAVIVVPLLLKGQVIGTIITINHIDQRAFTQQDVEMLMALTAHAATAIENVELVSKTTNWAHTLEQQVAQRMRELERRATQISTVAEVARVVTSLLDPEQLIAQVVDLIQERFGFYYVGLFLLDENGEYAVLSQGSGEAGRLMKERAHRLQVGGQSMVGWVSANKRARIALDVGEESVHFANPLLPGTHSEVALPLHIGGQIRGVLDVQSTEVAAFDESDVAVLQNMTDQVAVALENARLYTAVQQELVERRQAEAALLAQKQLFENLVAIARATVERPALEDTLQNALVVTTTLTGAKQGSIFLVDEEGVVTHSILGRTTERGEQSSIVGKVMKSGLAGWVIRERQPALISDTYEDQRWLLLPDAPFMVRSALAVPVMSGGSLVGVLTLQHEAPHHFNLEHLSLMQAAADQMALALRNAQMYEEQRDLVDQLLAAKESAEAANRAKSDFLATMSHELRTPLTAVLGMTNLLLNTPVTPDQKEYAETILTSGDALLSLIDDLLDFSKIEAGKLETEQQPFDLRACVEASLDLVSARAAEKGLALAYKADSAIPGTLIGDMARLRQVVVNLLGNAVKFTEQGEVLLTISATPLASPGERQGEGAEWYELHFAVKDTGIGIPAERRGHLFKAFSQGDASMTRRYGGTGLGLVISRRLTELMGGRMWVESEGVLGQGSTFHFTIQAQATTAPPPAYLLPEQPQLRGKRLLIVGENAMSRSILKEQLQAWGMVPQESASSSDALELLRRGARFDAAILDIEVQGEEVDSLLLAAQIRQQRDSQSLPLVLLTSVARREAAAGAQIQFAAALSKPIKPSHLYDTLVGLLVAQAEHVPVPSSAPTRAIAALPTLDPEMAQRIPLRILMAEDNVVNQKLTLRILKHLGYQVDVAQNGVEALTAVQEQSYDVVLMDVQMPEMDGL
ncbi:MAG: GAF domain-containing protein, partial [Ardenticatenales bacterium]|nr:GAF domain-containing protein [Ardenticatenales bacterium]